MSTELNIARQVLLEPGELSENTLEKLLGKLLTPSIDAADLYFQSSHYESWVLEDGIIKEGNYSIDQGVGVRAIRGDKTGFSYSDEIVLPALEEAVRAASSIALHGGREANIVPWKSMSRRAQLYHETNPLTSLNDVEKVALLKRVEQEARAQDPRVRQVIVSLAGVFETICVAASDGTLSADVRPLVRLNVNVIVEEKGRREQGNSGGGGRSTYALFTEKDRGAYFAKEAVRQALVNLEAVPAPAGMMPVVLGPGWPGVLLHEAIGHGLEGDFNRKGSSVFSGKLGQSIASPLCTIVDDGTLPGRRGSLHVDDEGTPTQCTTLIEKGILVGYMQDKLNARLMGKHSTGNGRRESYAHLPMPRMTNTYMLPGPHDPKEIIASVEKGLYAVNFGGGQVDITSGKFVFSASEAYLIENGRITRPVKGATLIGQGSEVLSRITMVGNDLKLDEGVGVCGKEGQSVPVGVGQPTLLIQEMTVGGTQT